MNFKTASGKNTFPTVPAILCFLILLAAFGAGLVQTHERIMRHVSWELNAMFDNIVRAQGPYNDLLGFMSEATHARGRGDEQLARLDRINRAAALEINRWRMRRFTAGAAERVRRITLRELHNVRALVSISRECALIQSNRDFEGHNNPCFSFAGPQAVREIEQGRRELQKILASPEQFTVPPAPAPVHAFSVPVQRPNIVVVLIDTLRADRAFDPELMPFLNRLAARGAAYTNARSQAPITHQSVASLFTGLFPLTHGLISDESHWLNHLSLIEEFRRAGYQTAAFSANDLIAPETGYGFGFDHFTSRYWASADGIQESVYAWLETAEARGGNFLLYIHTVDPHSQYAAPDRLAQVLSDPDPDWTLAILPNLWRRRFIDRGAPIPEPVRTKSLKKMMRNYDDEVRYADSRLKSLVDYLRGNGLMRNTILVVIADHGEAFLEHGDVEHTRSVYDEMIRVPIIFTGPGFTQPESMAGVREAVDLIDVFPTLLDAVRLPIPSRVQGRSLLRKNRASLNMSMTTMGFIGRSLSFDQTMIAGYKGPVKTIFFKDKHEFQCFDLVRDKGESRPVLHASGPVTNQEKVLLASIEYMKKQYKVVKPQAERVRLRGSRKSRAFSANELRDAQDKSKNEMRRRLKNLGYVE